MLICSSKKKKEQIKRLFETTELGPLSIKNRLVRSVTWENMTTPDGHMPDRLYTIYEELAKNEVGMIITGYANMEEEERPNPGMWAYMIIHS